MGLMNKREFLTAMREQGLRVVLAQEAEDYESLPFPDGPYEEGEVESWEHDAGTAD